MDGMNATTHEGGGGGGFVHLPPAEEKYNDEICGDAGKARGPQGGCL